MRPIPVSMRNRMAADPYYQKCAFHKRAHPGQKLEWHHNLIYAGRQQNKVWAILPICVPAHRAANNPKVKEYLNWIMLNRATDEELKEYPRRDLIRERDRLNTIYDETHRAVLPPIPGQDSATP